MASFHTTRIFFRSKIDKLEPRPLLKKIQFPRLILAKNQWMYVAISKGQKIALFYWHQQRFHYLITEHRPAEKSYESQYIGFGIIITEMYFHNKNLQF